MRAEINFNILRDLHKADTGYPTVPFNNSNSINTSFGNLSGMDWKKYYFDNHESAWIEIWSVPCTNQYPEFLILTVSGNHRYSKKISVPIRTENFCSDLSSVPKIFYPAVSRYPSARPIKIILSNLTVFRKDDLILNQI